jgi:hypothetical protein
VKHLLLGAMLLCGVAGLSTRAEAQNYPWCAILNLGEWSSNCGFATEQQCRASISGVGGFCTPNTSYMPAAPMRAPHKRRHLSSRLSAFAPSVPA